MKKHLGRHTYRDLKGEDGLAERWKNVAKESMLATILRSQKCIKCGETKRQLIIVGEARNT